MKNIHSVSQAYAMKPFTIEIGDTVITPPPIYKKPLIKRKAICFEIENDQVKNVYPARVKFRGFDDKSVGESYIKISEYMKDNVDELLKETKN